jgi:hypothetical protein
MEGMLSNVFGQVQGLQGAQEQLARTVFGQMQQMQGAQDQLARAVGQLEANAATGAVRSGGPQEWGRGGARGGDTAAEQVVAAIKVLEASPPSGLKWSRAHEAQRTKAWAAAGLLTGQLSEAEAVVSLDLLVLEVARLKGWGAALTAKGAEKDGRGWAARWKGAGLEGRLQMVREAANLPVKELTAEAQRRKQGRDEKREERKQKEAEKTRQEDVTAAQRVGGTALGSQTDLANAMLQAFAQGREQGQRSAATSQGGWAPGPAGYQQQGAQQPMVAPAAPMYGSGQVNAQVPWGSGQDPYGQQASAWAHMRPPHAPGQLFGQHQAPTQQGMWPYSQQMYGAAPQHTQMAYTPPQVQAAGQTAPQGGGRSARQYICFRCGKPGHIAPHCTVNAGEQSGSQ